jgi:hypothetical protein
MSGSVAVVLHLVPDALEQGRLAGEAEVVDSGARALFNNAEDLVTFVRCHRERNEPTEQSRS